jgi:hypothetical protein
MKVDMSPEAISGRLKSMGQLWDLSVALIRSRTLDGVELRPSRWQIALIQDSIRRVLIDEWDPIGIRGIPGAVAEYDAYIGRVHHILIGNRSAAELEECLRKIEKEDIGVSTSSQVRRKVALELLALNVQIGKDQL